MALLDLLIPVAIVAAAFGLAYVSPVVAAVIGVLVLLFANPLFTVIDYRLTEAAFEVTAFRAIRLRRVPYGEILSVRRLGWSELFNAEARWAESLGSNIFRPLVLVRRRGRRRPMIVTPANTDAFVQALGVRAQAGGAQPGAGAAGVGGSGWGPAS
jgi:hypothetical protein